MAELVAYCTSNLSNRKSEQKSLVLQDDEHNDDLFYQLRWRG
jgi:hypothetical protein